MASIVILSKIFNLVVLQFGGRGNLQWPYYQNDKIGHNWTQLVTLVTVEVDIYYGLMFHVVMLVITVHM